MLDAINKTNDNIESIKSAIKSEIDSVRAEVSANTQRLDKVESDLRTSHSSEKVAELSLQIELLKQDRLRNNLRITGLPQNALNDPDDTILRIAEALKIDVIPSDYSVYADRNKSSIIASFASHIIKRYFTDAMRKKQSLFVEEIYESTQSNARIYINDQLSPYFAKLFQLAWQAKKSGSLFSVTSFGGRIRVKKFENGILHTIETEDHLQDAIAITDQMETENEAQPIQQSHCLQDTNSSQHQTDSPVSIDSNSARQLRGKSFSHQRQQHHNHPNHNHQPLSSRNLGPNRHQSNLTSTHYKSNRQEDPNAKRNNRHVSSLDSRSYQPTGKRTRRTSNQHDNVPGDFTEYRRQYQNRLRGFTK